MRRARVQPVRRAQEVRPGARRRPVLPADVVDRDVDEPAGGEARAGRGSRAQLRELQHAGEPGVRAAGRRRAQQRGAPARARRGRRAPARVRRQRGYDVQLHRESAAVVLVSTDCLQGNERWVEQLETSFREEFAAMEAAPWVTSGTGVRAGTVRTGGGGGATAGNVTFVAVHEAGYVVARRSHVARS